MNNVKEIMELTINAVRQDGVKSGNDWYNISKYSAFKDFKEGETYKVEVEQYEYDGFLRRRILRVVK